MASCVFMQPVTPFGALNVKHDQVNKKKKPSLLYKKILTKCKTRFLTNHLLREITTEPIHFPCPTGWIWNFASHLWPDKAGDSARQNFQIRGIHTHFMGWFNVSMVWDVWFLWISSFL